MRTRVPHSSGTAGWRRRLVRFERRSVRRNGSIKRRTANVAHSQNAMTTDGSVRGPSVAHSHPIERRRPPAASPLGYRTADSGRTDTGKKSGEKLALAQDRSTARRGKEGNVPFPASPEMRLLILF